MGGGVSAGTADLHVYDFDPAINANYATTGSSGANINKVLTEEESLAVYSDVVTKLGFTPAHIYDGDLVLNEGSAYNVCRIAANDGVERNVALTRDIKAGNWSTIVLPFAVSKTDLETAFGTNATVAQFTGATENALSFSTVTTLNANEPYLIKVDGNVSGVKTFSGVTVANSANPQIGHDDFIFKGTYVSGNVPAHSYVLSNNTLYKESDDKATIKPFRAYFAGGGSTQAHLAVRVDGELTGIKNPTLDPSMLNSQSSMEIFDFQGRRVTNPKQGNYYIINGVKVRK